ncbi:MAG: 50S ribosomal protein L22 [Bacillota bacterium]|jgi:large subunit ribosomal protein L22|nr:50S ribosomal protein L22 [Bacillota bacterium]NLU54694.1 50S ribosomal protein L22 [Bacillota bacterium]HOA90465.1 50S ribosomal protein L22 [Bacillota bacterium]HOJ45995.1 50S ribosomal protein L22 [Bacillota bacterium]HOL12788.1 50S ribosomal protein L22 [Bacillota bacterium]
MEAKATARMIRMSPRKVRQVIDAIRGKSLQEAQQILKVTPRRATYYIGKVLNSAAANAENNYNMDRDLLYVKKAYVDEGPTMKRYRFHSRGQVDTIFKRTCHITVVLSEKKEG